MSAVERDDDSGGWRGRKLCEGAGIVGDGGHEESYEDLLQKCSRAASEVKSFEAPTFTETYLGDASPAGRERKVARLGKLREAEARLDALLEEIRRRSGGAIA